MLFFSITCAEEAQHLQLEPWAPAWKGRRLLPCKKASDYVEHDMSSRTISRDPLCGLRDSLSTRTLSTLTSVSNRFTFMTTRRGVQDQVVDSRNRDGIYKVFFHVPHFVEPQSVVRRSVLYCPCISATFTLRKKASPRSSSRLFVPL